MKKIYLDTDTGFVVVCMLGIIAFLIIGYTHELRNINENRLNQFEKEYIMAPPTKEIELTPSQETLLAFIETRCVDHMGYLEPRSLRGKPEINTVHEWVESGFLIRTPDGGLQMTDASWLLAHKIRREMAELR